MVVTAVNKSCCLDLFGLFNNIRFKKNCANKNFCSEDI